MIVGLWRKLNVYKVNFSDIDIFVVKMGRIELEIETEEK